MSDAKIAVQPRLFWRQMLAALSGGIVGLLLVTLAFTPTAGSDAARLLMWRMVFLIGSAVLMGGVSGIAGPLLRAAARNRWSFPRTIAAGIAATFAAAIAVATVLQLMGGAESATTFVLWLAIISIVGGLGSLLIFVLGAVFVRYLSQVFVLHLVVVSLWFIGLVVTIVTLP